MSIRTTAREAVSSYQDQALSATIFLLRSYGPAAFLLQEEVEGRNFKVCLGEQLLLKKFRLPREHVYAFKPGLSSRELRMVLQRPHTADAASGTQSQNLPDQKVGSVCRKVIQAQDVCPICQEGLLQKKEPVSHCRFGCGNCIHISCMKVWADHQRLADSKEIVKCPMCRGNFGSLQLLQEQSKNAAKLFTAAERENPDKHLGAVCFSCRGCPITGACLRCTICSFLYLCDNCVKNGCHSQHPLASRTVKQAEKSGFLWMQPPLKIPNHKMKVSPLLSTVAEAFSAEMLKRLPVVKVRSGSQLLNEGLQCRICLQGFLQGQKVRTLPCQHKFHVNCVDQILRSNSCPLDEFIIFSGGRIKRNTSSKFLCAKQK
uniref:Zinc finger, SWIM-type containing 2 n=1 Tax=Cyprinodon variegatus TaxID=28743 RepID=A0A3Q2CLU6_CYPVA